MPNIQDKLRSEIAKRVKLLRVERHWPQSLLAKKIGLSQNRLSEVERGDGSFTAEQLVTILKLFNVPLDELVPQESTAGDQLHKALARLGASHLFESTDVLPTDRLKEVLTVIPEALASGDPRQIAALAPVLVNHADSLSFTKLHADCAALGLLHRLDWAVENTCRAIDHALIDKKLEPRWTIRYRTARLKLDQYLHGYAHKAPKREDVLDPIATAETLKEIERSRSPISKRWSIVTSLQPEDFQSALEAARD